jgi:U3 small nucleolar RNA-associated protein 13
LFEIFVCRNSNAFIVSGSQDTTAKVWSLEHLILDNSFSKEPQSLSSLFTLKTHDKEVNSVAVSFNDKHFATGSADKTAKVISNSFGLRLRFSEFRFGISEIRN